MRSLWVATMVPLPGRDRPSASVRQFIELAVNMPEQEPQVGQAERSISATSASDTVRSPALIMASTRSSLMIFSPPLTALITLPASIGPHHCCVKSGALYVFDVVALEAILRVGSAALEQVNAPTDPEMFVRFIARDWFVPDHPIMPIIRAAFADNARAG